MKLGVVFGLLLQLGVGAMSHADGSGKIYLYEFEVENADTTGAFDYGPKIIAGYLSQKGLTKNCVDLRQTGLHAQNDFVVRQGTGYLTNEKISDADLAGIIKELCQGAGKKCKAKHSMKSEKLASLSIEHDYVGRGEHDHLAPAKIGKIPVGQRNSLPQFSSACHTGNHEDSWNNAASTMESRQFLKDIGAKVEDIRAMSLGRLWTFGFPDHRLDGTLVPTGKAVKEKSEANTDR